MKNLRVTSRLRNLLKEALQEDIGTGDVTTETLIPQNQRGEAVISAKEPGVFCGGSVAREIFHLKDPSLRVLLHLRDGERIKAGARRAVPLLTIRGRIQSILEAERVALNFLGRLSGIATLTRSFVEKVKGTRARIFDTRKTTPLLRELEKYAVRSGGGENHRLGLWDEILVKDNHWAAMSVIARARSARSNLRDCFVVASRLLTMTRKQRKIPIEVEVKNLKELARLLEGTFIPDRVLLDNFSIRELKRGVLFVDGLNFVLKRRYGIRRKRPLLEASGGINLTNVRAVAKTGVDRISVGYLTHSSPSLDFSLHIKR